jgi:hypothetical protein
MVEKLMGKNLGPITFVVPVSNDVIYQKNFLSSPLFSTSNNCQILTQRGFSSAPKAYNAAIDQALNEVIIFTHQDVFFPESWLAGLEGALRCLETQDPNWGVLGCFGSAKGKIGGVGRVYTTGMGMHGKEIIRPEPVETLDEIVLVVRKSSGLRFDPFLPHFHLYGVDICMSAKEKGMGCYAIPDFCIHNTMQIIDLPKEFYSCYRYVKKKWSKYLPIYASCIKISRFDKELYLRQIRKMYGRLRGRGSIRKCRAEDPMSVLAQRVDPKD